MDKPFLAKLRKIDPYVPGEQPKTANIIKELWGPRAGGDNQILRVNMANIRRKIEKNPAEPEYLFTEVGVGYRMAENPSGE